MNLKYTLMELGNRLVQRGFTPAAWESDISTRPIVKFTEWLNNTPEATEILAEMGIDWPVVTK